VYYSDFDDARERPLIWPKTNNNPLGCNILDEEGGDPGVSQARLCKKLTPSDESFDRRDVPARRRQTL